MKSINIIRWAVAIGLLFGAAALHAATQAGYLRFQETEAETESKHGQKTLELEIKTESPIPVDGKAGAFGYAALTAGTDNVLVVVTHLPIDDSSHEQAGSGFHTHVLDLKQPTAACSGANFEVDLVNSGKNKAFDADYSWQIKDRKISVEEVPVTDLGDAGVESIVSFTLKPVLGPDQKPTHLCVTVVDQD